jgi:TonB family protein
MKFFSKKISLFALPFLIFLLKINEISGQPDSVFQFVQQAPRFAKCAEFEGETTKQEACSMEKLFSFIAENLEYPALAREKGVEGRVILSFVVEKNGVVSDIKIVRDAGSGCGEAAIKMMQKMPNWQPGKHDGQAVRTKMILPVLFKLTKDEPENAGIFTINWGKVSGENVKNAVLKNHLETPVLVRDQDGNSLKINELSFTFEKKKKTSKATVAGAVLDKSMKKIIKKATPGGIFTVTATVQENGRFRIVEQSFKITE